MDGAAQKRLFDIVSVVDIFVAIGREFFGNLIEHSISWGKQCTAAPNTRRDSCCLYLYLF